MSNEQFVKTRYWIALAIVLISYPAALVLSIIHSIYKNVCPVRKEIANEVALVTGSGHGLGREIAIKLAIKGCHIAVVDINEEGAKSTAEMLRNTFGIKSMSFKTDITKYDEVQELAKKVEKHLGPVTILVNNAGKMTYPNHFNPDPNDIRKMINTNVTSHFWTISAFLDGMKERKKGHIVAISSAGGVLPLYQHTTYSTTKFAVRGLMSTLATDLAATKCEFIKTTTVYPFFLKTNQDVLNRIQDSRIQEVYPYIDGDEAAEAVVEGIVKNEIDVFIPWHLAWLSRIIWLLPKYWQEVLIKTLCGRIKIRF